MRDNIDKQNLDEAQRFMPSHAHRADNARAKASTAPEEAVRVDEATAVGDPQGTPASNESASTIRGRHSRKAKDSKKPLFSSRKSSAKARKRTKEAGADLDFSSQGIREVQERLNKLSIAVTVAVAVTVFAILFAFWAAWSSYSQRVQLENNVRAVIVASQDISVGTTITKDMLASKEIPEEYLGGGVTSDASKLIGRTANVGIAAQTPIATNMVSGASNTSSAAAQLEKGEQAVSLSVSTEDGVAGVVNQGDMVDVLAVLDGTAKTLFKSKRVISLDASLTKNTTSYKNVVLALSAIEAKELREHQSKGYLLTLALNPASSKKGE